MLFTDSYLLNTCISDSWNLTSLHKTIHVISPRTGVYQVHMYDTIWLHVMISLFDDKAFMGHQLLQLSLYQLVLATNSNIRILVFVGKGTR